MASSMTLAKQAESDRIVINREPFLPLPEHWNKVADMLCGKCDLNLVCKLPQAMINFAQGRGEWPENAWVTDPGAGATCLSYTPMPGEPLKRQRLEALAKTPDEKLPHICGGCAAKKGTEASVALHTQRDYRAAVRDKTQFTCHEDPTNQRLCGGWCRAVQRKEV